MGGMFSYPKAAMERFARGLKLTAGGVFLSAAAGPALTRLLGRLLCDVSPGDPSAFGAALAVMTITQSRLVLSWMACYLYRSRSCLARLILSCSEAAANSLATCSRASSGNGWHLRNRSGRFQRSMRDLSPRRAIRK